jgi:hypothetical protein
MGASITLIIWHFSDGTSGHDQQALGLIRALANRVQTHTYTLSTPLNDMGFVAALKGRFRFAEDLPAPDLIIGAGHHTHIPMLAARATHGGKIIVLMKPSLPMWLFDLCLVPEHDRVKARRSGRVQLTKGVLNTVQPSYHHQLKQGVFLVGGPCKHTAWSDEQVCQQIQTICSDQNDVHFDLSNSRRTPPSFFSRLRALHIPNLTLTAYTQTEEGWVNDKLRASHQAWVTGDSVSMVYEALTAGASVGILSIPMRRHSRVNNGLLSLVKSQYVISYEQWKAGAPLVEKHNLFNEAARCADIILKRWYANAQIPAQAPTLTLASSSQGKAITKTRADRRSHQAP